MKSNNEVRLSLEVLEDRIALNGSFGGAIQAGIPFTTPFNPATIQTMNFGQVPSGFRYSPAEFNNPFFSPARAFQSQLHTFQANQIAMIDHIFSEMQSLLQQLHLNTVVLI